MVRDEDGRGVSSKFVRLTFEVLEVVVAAHGYLPEAMAGAGTCLLNGLIGSCVLSRSINCLSSSSARFSITCIIRRDRACALCLSSGVISLVGFVPCVKSSMVAKQLICLARVTVGPRLFWWGRSGCVHCRGLCGFRRLGAAGVSHAGWDGSGGSGLISSSGLHWLCCGLLQFCLEDGRVARGGKGGGVGDGGGVFAAARGGLPLCGEQGRWSCVLICCGLWSFRAAVAASAVHRGSGVFSLSVGGGGVCGALLRARLLVHDRGILRPDSDFARIFRRGHA